MLENTEFTNTLIYFNAIIIGCGIAICFFRKYIGNPFARFPLTEIIMFIITLIGTSVTNVPKLKNLFLLSALPMGLLISYVLSVLSENKKSKKSEKSAFIDSTEPINSDPYALATQRSPFPAYVLKITAEEGATVNKGDIVMSLEAMKMENDIVSPESGVIHYHVSKKDAIDTNTPLFTISRY